MLSKRKRRKLAGKNMKVIISKEIEGSGDSNIDETTTDSVNNEHANCSIVVNEFLDENQEVTDLSIENNNNAVTDSVPPKCNKQNTERNNPRKINQSIMPLSYLILSLVIILNINIILMVP